MFSRKLNFLMNINNITNSTLAHSISLDASHISRLRRGQRNLPKNQSFLIPMSEYFAHQIKADYQKKALLAAMQYEEKKAIDEKAMAELIYKWLKEDTDKGESSVENILNSFSLTASKNTTNMTISDQESTPLYNSSENYYYYGNDGKREAVIRFLSMIVKEEAPQTLLLFSDEELSWLYDDAEFAKRWSVLLKQVLLKGNRIKIIHTVNRNINEMLEAVAKWIPVYISGAIDPYYYPKLRDGIFKRTLFIAPKTAAIVSTSVQESTDNMLNFFITDKKAIGSLIDEYTNYFSLCRPLMKIFNIITRDKYWDIFFEMENANATGILIGSAPSLMSMPQSVVNIIADNTNNNLITKIYQKSKESFEEIIGEHNITEILSLPSIIKITKGSVIIPLSDMINGKEFFYTKDEFRMHLENVVMLLKKHKNYNVLLLKKHKDENIVLYGKEDVGIMLLKCDYPSVVFAIREPNMTAAFWDYLLNVQSKVTVHKKETVIIELNKIIDQLN